MIAGVIADHHIEDHAGNIALHLITGLPTVFIGIAIAGFSMEGSSVVKVLVIAGGIHRSVGWSQVMQVGVGCIGFAGKSVGFGPDVFAIPGFIVLTTAAIILAIVPVIPVIPIFFLLGTTGIDQNDIVGIIGVFIGFLDDVPGLIIGFFGVIADDIMEGGFEG